MDTMNFPTLEEALKEKKITSKTYDRVKIARGYIEKKYKMKKIQEDEKRKDWELITQKLNELQITDKEADNIKKAIQHKEAEYSRIKRKKMTIREFESIAIIGKGAFGEVRICRHIQNDNEIFAIKKMKKEEMHTKNQIHHIRAERDVLSEAHNEWIVDLKYSFQDDYYLYLVMEFLPGGDLMTLLMTKDILTEDEARFYAAELVLAIESVHKLKCIHRDLKPDNVLIRKNGHIKLSDFGLSKKTDLNLYDNEDNLNNISENELQILLNKEGNVSKARKKRIFAYSTVGTPDYIAPEVFTMKGYGPQVDWWSLGVILFEMLIGYAPFSSENPTLTCKKILNYRQFLQFSDEIQLSFEAMDLIKKLITDLDHRLGYNGADDIKNHPFFKSINWDDIHSTKPPFIPDIQNEYDTKYFDSFPEEESFYPEVKNSKKLSKDICFVDFSYKRGMDQKKTSIVSALEVLESIKISYNKNEIIDDKNHLRHISALTNLKENENNLKSSIVEPTIEYNPQREIIEEKEFPNKEITKSYSIDKDMLYDKNLVDKKIMNNNISGGNQKQSINKSNSSKINFEKSKENVNIKSVVNKDDKTITNTIQINNKPLTNNNNNIVNNVHSPKANKNIQYTNNTKINNHHTNIINNEKLNKNKETITFEEKKMTDKRNYESNSNDKETKQTIESKIAQTNSNVNLVSNNNAQSISEKNNDAKVKLSKNQVKSKNNNILNNLNLKKTNSSHSQKEEEQVSNSINEEILVGNISNKTNLIDRGATKKTTIPKVTQNQQYISTNYVKDFINSESNHKIDSKGNKISSNKMQKVQSKNNNPSNIVYANVALGSTNSVTGNRAISTKNSGGIMINPSDKITSGLKIKVPEIISEKDKLPSTPTPTNIPISKGLKIDLGQNQKLNNDTKGKK